MFQLYIYPGTAVVNFAKLPEDDLEPRSSNETFIAANAADDDVEEKS